MHNDEYPNPGLHYLVENANEPPDIPSQLPIENELQTQWGAFNLNHDTKRIAARSWSNKEDQHLESLITLSKQASQQGADYLEVVQGMEPYMSPFSCKLKIILVSLRFTNKLQIWLHTQELHIPRVLHIKLNLQVRTTKWQITELKK